MSVELTRVLFLFSVASRKRPAAFKGRQAVRVTATAEEQEQPSPAPAAAGAKAARAPRRVVTVDLAAVKPDDEFEGVVVRPVAMLTYIRGNDNKADGCLYRRPPSKPMVPSSTLALRRMAWCIFLSYR